MPGTLPIEPEFTRTGARARPYRTPCPVAAAAPGCHDAGRFGGRCQNRLHERPPDTVGEAGGSTGGNSDVALEEPIAFFTAAQIISREKGFSRNSDIPSFSALNATALGS